MSLSDDIAEEEEAERNWREPRLKCCDVAGCDRVAPWDRITHYQEIFAPVGYDLDLCDEHLYPSGLDDRPNIGRER